MDNITGAFDYINTMAKTQTDIGGDDYIGENGLYYCGKCHTPKQTIVNILGFKKTAYCLCKCKSEEVEAEKTEQKRREFFERVKRLRISGFPEKAMQEWTFDKDDGSNPKITNAMQMYVDKFSEFKADGKGLLLFGKCGTGKTFFAVCIANALIDKGIPCLVTNFARIANEVQGLFEGRQAYYDSLNKYSLLVIDDLSAERKTEYMQEIVFNVIDSRYRSGLPLIITTNLTSDEIKKPKDLTSQRIFSRLYEMCTPIEVTGVDRRKQVLRNDIDKYREMLGLGESE